jgi:hypothetical protein
MHQIKRTSLLQDDMRSSEMERLTSFGLVNAAASLIATGHFSVERLPPPHEIWKRFGCNFSLRHVHIRMRSLTSDGFHLVLTFFALLPRPIPMPILSALRAG